MIVIADDITGAAEMAGIAHSHGLHVRLVCGGCPVGCDSVAASEVVVMATDTRSMSEAEAAAETGRMASRLPSSTLLFKKTDSALRGHVVAELVALMEATGLRRAVYLPANPSKGRIVRDGVYYIKTVNGQEQAVREVPLHQTDFSFDPEFPARTSVLRERFPDAEAHHIIMPDAETPDNIRRTVALYDDGSTLFAGAADLFEAVLGAAHEGKSITQHPSPNTQYPSPITQHPTPNTLILCGSTQSRALDLGIPTAPMPASIYDGDSDLALWDTADYDLRGSLILTIPHTHRTGKTVAVHLRSVMAAMAKKLVDRRRPDHLVIEGGATAWAVLNALGWTRFTIERQVAPGVVQMRADCGTLVTLKPGSYPWGGLFH